MIDAALQCSEHGACSAGNSIAVAHTLHAASSMMSMRKSTMISVNTVSLHHGCFTIVRKTSRMCCGTGRYSFSGAGSRVGSICFAPAARASSSCELKVWLLAMGEDTDLGEVAILKRGGCALCLRKESQIESGQNFADFAFFTDLWCAPELHSHR